MISEKYGRTYHYPFSPGTTSDDRINHTYWEDIQRIKTLVHTEKLDGENNCLSQWGTEPYHVRDFHHSIGSFFQYGSCLLQTEKAEIFVRTHI